MTSDVTVDGVRGARPGREALTGTGVPGAADATLPTADDAFAAYYGQPVVRRPGWRESDIVGYFFTGGLAGAASVLATVDTVLGAHRAAHRMQVAAAAGSVASIGFLVHDLGRPARFLNMLRVFKPTSPMNLGSWLLGGYVPAALLAAGGGGLPVLRPLRGAAGWTAGVLGTAMTTYTAVLIADTAVPAWHAAGDELPFVFAGSSAAAAGGVGMLTAPAGQAGAARRFAVAGAAIELIASTQLRRRAGLLRPAHEHGAAGRLGTLGRGLMVAGASAAIGGRRSPLLQRVGGACWTAASLVTRLAIYRAGLTSADDPRYVVEPQRRRADARSDGTSH